MNDIKVPPFTDGQKQLIEMTEKFAEKRGGKICDVDGIDDDITDIIELLEDTISRIEGLTNEEYLKSCTTEQLAEWIVHIADQCTISHECNMCGLWCDEKQVIEWLKQPHKEE